MGFVNDAGAVKHQAVAMRSCLDLSMFYRCKFDAFQDTLYAHSNCQFYRECEITSTIDFIFGNVAVVFQSYNSKPSLPKARKTQIKTLAFQSKNVPSIHLIMSQPQHTLVGLGKTTPPQLSCSLKLGHS